MKNNRCLLLVGAVLLAVAVPVFGRDIKRNLPIAFAMETAELQPKIDGSIKTIFGKEAPRNGVTVLGGDATLGRTNTRGKSIDTACNQAFVFALAELQKRAKQMGANAVTNIISYYKKVEMSSATEFECHEGSGYMAVALKGDFVKIAEE